MIRRPARQPGKQSGGDNLPGAIQHGIKNVNTRKLVARIKGRESLSRPLALLLAAVALTGCQSGGLSHYSSPRVTGQVLAADTHQPLPEVTVKRVAAYPADGTGTQPKGGQLLMQPAGVRTDADGRFALEAEKTVAVFHRGGWSSVTVSFERAGYESVQTNYSTAGFPARSTEGVPLVNAGAILLQPQPK
jgi:hypothetical protein